ncbi:MAG: VanZ family protein [Planctomycetia bacterium]|nr:VanZ family protein [Planctomycetia bacterium]
MRNTLRWLTLMYWGALTFLLLVYNPFAYVPVEEEVVEQGFYIGLNSHMMVFLILAVLVCACRWPRMGVIWGILIFYAVGTEFLQGFTGRCPDWVDVYYNLLGLFCGGAGWWLTRLLSSIRNKF